jgi:hypothetical protein
MHNAKCTGVCPKYYLWCGCITDFRNTSEYPNINVGAVVLLIAISNMAFPPDDIMILIITLHYDVIVAATPSTLSTNTSGHGCSITTADIGMGLAYPVGGTN